MSWLEDDPKKIAGILKKVQKENKDLPLLDPETNRLYKLQILEDPKVVNVPGKFLKVKSLRDSNQYRLLVRNAVHPKLLALKLKNNDVIGLINLGQNMQTGYAVDIFLWTDNLNPTRKSYMKKYGRKAGGQPKNPKDT